MIRALTTVLYSGLGLLPQCTALATLALLSARLASNLQFLRWACVRARVPGDHLPYVSVLIPARNEATTISDCVKSLLDQRYPNLEILVLDDASTDGTGALVDALQARSSRLSVIHQPGDPPAGWTGKNYACHVLAGLATGDWLLFTDADTVHEPDSVARGIAYAAALDAAFVSVFPYQVVRTWGERLLVSFLLDFVPLMTINLPVLARGGAARVAANGQYLLVHAASYRALGGHASIHDELVDDFALAHRFHAEGHKIVLVQGARMLACRMYHNAREVWGGFSKNVLGALDAPRRWRTLLWVPIFAWLYACLFVLPFVQLWSHQRCALAVVEIAWLLLLRTVLVWRLKRPVDEIVTTPLAAWSVMALGLTAVLRRWLRVPIVWKGRKYLG